MCVLLRISFCGPVKDVVKLKSPSNKKTSEDLPEVRIIRSIFESQRPDVLHIDRNLARLPTTELVNADGPLLVHDKCVPPLVRFGLHSVPREMTPKEVEEQVSQAFHIIASRLFCFKISYTYLRHLPAGLVNLPMPR